MLPKKILSIPIAILLSFSIIFVSCDNAGTGVSGDTGDTGTMEVQLHDAPANYEEVNVFIESVEINNSEEEGGWEEFSTPQQTYDLLELTNGATEVLGSKELPIGTYEQIRLILSTDGHNIVVDGEAHDMFVPSGEQTGIKLNVNAEIQPDITYTLLLDFDASRSVVERGNEQSGIDYLLKPVISATNEAESGNIAGAVDPVDAQPFVHAIADSDTLSSTKADTSDGSFKLIGLEDGDYTVSVDPTNENYQPKDTTGVSVAVGETNDIGTIELSGQE